MSNKIKLDEKYSIAGKKYNWVLTFQEKRIKQVLDKNRNPSGEEDYLFEDQWYFNSIKQALNKYVTEVSKQSNTAKQLITLLTKINKTINKLEVCK